jgi:hypothetical protein
MPAWRAILTIMVMSTIASASESPKSQCEQLLNEMMPVAKKFLSEHGEFFPFGASMKPNGEIVYAAGYDGREKPPSQAIIDILRDAFRADAVRKKIIASALVYDVRVIPPRSNTKTDAVAVELDHRDDYSVIMFYPYSIHAKNVEFRDPFMNSGDHRVFARYDN